MAESDFNFDSEWKHLLRWARAVWECESNGKNEWFKIKMETK